MVTYARLRDGSWGLRGLRLKEGTKVQVSKRDRTVKQETVGEILWEDAQGRCLATIAGRKPSVKDEVCDYCQEDIRGMTYSKAYHNVHPSCPSGKYCGSCYHEIMEDMDVFDW